MRTIKVVFIVMMLAFVIAGFVPAGFAQTASDSLQPQASKTLTPTVATPSTLSVPKSSIRIGVLAKRGRQQCLDQWGPTADYLGRQIPECSFSIEPLDFDQIYAAVANQDVDFIFANSSFYIELEVRFGVTRIATLNNLHSDGTGHAVFAGVIFTRADRADIKGLQDLPGKSVMAVDERSLGGWHMEWREMKAMGIDPHRDLKALTYGGTHDSVVYAVRDRTVDAGCVRSDTLERMESEGKIELSQFKLIKVHKQSNGNVRLLHSTQHYPEWPMAKAYHTSEALAKKVAVALMGMPASSPAAVVGQCAGWTIPQNYQPVRECLMELCQPPYQNYKQVSLGDFWCQYKFWLFGIAALLTLIVVGAIYASRLQASLKQSVLAQKERERSQAFLQTVIDALPEALMVINADYTIALANRTVKVMIGSSDLAESGLKCHQLSHDCDQPCRGALHPCPLEQIFTTKKSVTLEHIHYDNTGEERFVEIVASPIFDEQGAVVKIIESWRDITERKQAEEALRESRQRLDNIVANSPGAIYRCFNAPEWTMEFLSAAITWITGYPAEDFLNNRVRSYPSIIHPDDLHRVEYAVAVGLAHKDHFNIDYRIIAADGTLRWVHEQGQGVFDPEGCVLCVDGIIFDITAEKQAEEELRHYWDQLEETVEKRTQELQLAREAAENANRSKSTFLANMSHELRTPLNAILGFSQLMKNSADATPQQLESLNIITRSGENLLNLINNVLDISKIEAGRVELKESHFDLYQMIQEIKSLIYVRAFDKGLRFDVEQSADLPQYIAIDGGKLNQVLINLIGNAIKYTSSGSMILRVMVVAKKDISEQVQLRFEVEDTGPGISEEGKKRLFSPFVRLGEHTSVEAGTGLGLAISKQYVELMGGQIGVTSEPGIGSLFYFEIPVSEVSDGVIPAAAQNCHAMTLAEGQPHYRLLIAEDQPDNRLLLRKLLEPLGFELREAVNGEEAVAVCKQWHPQLIWMDMRMPVMDGLEATRRIRATESGEKTKIIAVTAHALEDERNEILTAGCDDFIRKPYRDSEICDALKKHLGASFIYKEETPPAAVVELDVAALTGLPDTMRNELEQALILLDTSAVSRAIEKIRPQNATLADALAAVASELQYSRILQLIRVAKGETSPEEQG